MVEKRVPKIVLIDDEKSFCDIIFFALKKAGFDVICFTNPKEALLKIVEIIPDLVLLDILMPGIDGYELITHLKKDLGPKCPPIFLLTNLRYTTDGRILDDKLAKSFGAAGVIQKSGNLDNLLEKINEVLHGFNE